MIEVFRCDNFKSLRRFKIHFRTPLTVIAGANGSGKTTICQALATAGRLVSESPQVVMDEVCQKNWEFIKNKWASANKPYFVLDVKNDKETPHWGIRLVKRDKWDILDEFVRIHPNSSPDDSNEILRRKENNISLALFNPITEKYDKFDNETKQLPSYLSTVVKETSDQYPALWFLKNNIRIRYIPFLDPVQLRRKSNYPILGDTGQNFAYYLVDFKKKNPTQFKQIVAGIKRFFPWLEDIKTKSTKYGWSEVQAVVKPVGEEDNVIFSSWQISDGLLRILALATIPYAEPDLKMLIFEEPENGIHPKLIGATVELLRSMENIQIVLTTHSPVLLNYLKPEEVVVLVPQGKSGPVAVPFTELDKADERLEYFDVGDILFHENEWELAKPYLQRLKEQIRTGKK